MCLELKVAFEFGKRNGLESQNENLATANFLLESQLKELRKIVGEKISIIGGVKIFFANDFNYPVCLLKIPVK